jgi:MFS family permease
VTDGDGPTAEWASDRRVKATLVFTGSLSILAAAIVSPALPAIRAAFPGAELTVARVTLKLPVLTGLVLTLPALFIAAAAPVVGGLIDRVGRLPVLAGGAVVYAVGGGAPLVVETLPAVLASRALLGLGVAGLFVTSTALITDYYSGQTQSAMLGIQGALATASGVVFLPLAGVLVGLSWRGPFLLYLVALALIPAVVRLLREPRETAETTPASSPSRNSLTAVAAPLAAAYGLAFVGMTAFYTLPVQLPFYLAATTGSGATGSGVVLAVAMLSGGLVALSYRRVRAVVGVYGTVAVTFLAMGAGLATLGAATGLAGVVAGVAVVGGAQGLLVPNLNAWVAAVVPDAARGRALSGVVTGLFVGQFCSALVSQPAVERVGFGTTYLAAGGVLLAVGLTALVGRLVGGAGPDSTAGPSGSLGDGADATATDD